MLDDASPAEGFSDKIRELCANLGFQYYRSPRNLRFPETSTLVSCAPSMPGTTMS